MDRRNDHAQGRSRVGRSQFTVEAYGWKVLRCDGDDLLIRVVLPGGAGVAGVCSGWARPVDDRPVDSSGIPAGAIGVNRSVSPARLLCSGRRDHGRCSWGRVLLIAAPFSRRDLPGSSGSSQLAAQLQGMMKIRSGPLLPMGGFFAREFPEVGLRPLSVRVRLRPRRFATADPDRRHLALLCTWFDRPPGGHAHLRPAGACLGSWFALTLPTLPSII